ncbi:MAG: chromosome segregation protein SMC [Halobacteriales archaeon]
MYLEALVLDNFKSFAEKTRIPLRDDFTAITGPNGSGKSNILDAIQFALGLGRVSDVRARRLTDLIHHADDGEPRLPREAEVTVVLNNEEEALAAEDIAAATGEPVTDPTRIRIRRRIRQTSNNSYSYYYIDDHKVNLGDIRELMAKASVSDERYNIVPQGDITELINRTPMQRRLIIDEIAGVAEFDEKKARAEAELETVRERIDEVSLRIEEKASTLEQLADEREEALAYRELAEEKAEYERHRDAAELRDRRERLAEVSSEIEAIEAELETARADLAEAEEVARQIEEDIEDLTVEIERKGGEEQRELREEIEGLRGDIGQLEGRIEEKRDRIDELRAERRDAELRIDRAQERLEDIEGERRDLKVEKASRSADLVDLREERAGVEAAIDDLDATQRRLNARLAKQEALLDRADDVRADLQRELDRVHDAARRRDRELSELSETIDDLEATRAERVEDREAVDLEMNRIRRERSEVQDAIEALEAEEADLSGALSDVTADLEAANERLEQLRRQRRDDGRGQFPRAVARVMGADLEGVHGPIANLGDVPEEAHAEACEAAGGGRLANVVVDDAGTAQRGIEYLKTRDAGRATFLPMTEFDERSLPPRPDHPGVVDFARNLVTYDERYAGVFSYVLGSTLVVENMATARELMGEFRMATLDGDVVERSSAMRGGSGRETPYRFGGEGGRIRRLASEIEALERDRTELADDLDAVREELIERRERDRTLRDDLRDLERDREHLVERIEAVDGRLERADERREELETEREATRDRLDALGRRIEAADAAVEAIDAAVRELKAALADTQLGELTERRTALTEEIAEVEAEVERLDGRLNELVLEERSTSERVEELQSTVAEAQNGIADREAEIEELTAEIEALDAEIDEREAAITALEDDLTDLRAEREARRDDLEDARQTVTDHRRRVGELESELGPKRSERERLEWEIDELEDAVGPVEGDEDVPDLDLVTDRIAELEAEMTAMEPINQKAVEQYDRLEEEVDGLEGDVDELRTEREELLERIASYEDQKRTAFMEAFEAIDEAFRSIFRTLSGGTARLELEDEEDPFDGGLLVRAQPEDKFVGSLEQLSGGEKSLTALSLIFAIQRYRPAPFYALDEIDAFLDAANLDRIGDLLEAHRDDGQFIVISHHADLLERADHVIGVSMPDDTMGTQVSGISLEGASADD